MYFGNIFESINRGLPNDFYSVGKRYWKMEAPPNTDFETLNDEEKLCLVDSIKPINVRFANREQVFGYLYLLERKINTIEAYTSQGKFFENFNVHFSSEFVYKALVDLAVTMQDYLRVKDMLLYREYAKEAENDLCSECKLVQMV